MKVSYYLFQLIIMLSILFSVICFMLCHIFVQNPSAPSPLAQMPPQDGLPPGTPIPSGFFPVCILSCYTFSTKLAEIFKLYCYIIYDAGYQ